jgi:hypothetical protein
LTQKIAFLMPNFARGIFNKIAKKRVRSRQPNLFCEISSPKNWHSVFFPGLPCVATRSEAYQFGQIISANLPVIEFCAASNH